MTRKFHAAIVFFAALHVAIVANSAQAQDSYPNRLIRWVVPYGTGTGADILARLLGPMIAERWKVPVVVENRPGASAVIGHEYLSKSAPNGYTMGFSATSFTANVPMVRTLPYDPMKSFDQVVLVATNITSFCIANTVPAKTLADFMALAKRNPGKMNFGSTGSGAPQHMAMELFKLEARIDLVAVPYKGSPGAISDLIAGHIQAMVLPLQTAAPHARNGSIRMLAIMSAQRAPAFPDIPSMRELGFPSVDVDTWYGIFAPAGTPKEIIARWNGEVNGLLKLPEVRDAFDKQGLVPAGGTPERFTQLLREDLARWTRVVRETGIKAE